MKRVLFVDDEVLVLQGLRRTLRPMRDRWKMVFEEDPERAVELIRAEDFDVIVSDMRMPKYSGIDVLEAAKEHCPIAVRIGLSGFANSDMQFEAARVAHQYFAKPCDLTELVAAIDSVTRLQHRLNNPELQQLVQSLTSLPSIPSLYTEVTQEATAENGSLDRVGEIVAKDLGMTSKILQLVNSAHFGLTAEVNSPSQAASILGFDTLRTLILAIKVFSGFREKGAESITSLWEHCLGVGDLAARVARHMELDRKSIEQARLAGMLHDIGQLLIISERAEDYRAISSIISKQGVQRVDAEQEVLGCTHADIGAYILTLWGFFAPVVEAVAHHHHPHESGNSELSPLTAVHVANVVHRQLRGDGDEIDADYLGALGIDDSATDDFLSLAEQAS